MVCMHVAVRKVYGSVCGVDIPGTLIFESMLGKVRRTGTVY
jgi:hypothetical protein